ncbi:response regulator [Terasakiella pusilla]|uniref:response regulator n=1 Tax=Terasakiella pusilla TaxID=64973 RepID=UPI003AA8212A
MKLLIVEDNVELNGILQQAFKKEGFAVDCVLGSEDAQAAVSTASYDCIILDLGLPDGDGLDVLKFARQHKKHVPVLILTARDGIDERVKGLDLGADDYCLKPFEIKEIMARIRALLRRPGGALGAQLSLGNIEFDTIQREAHIDGSLIRLSKRELDVLEELMRRSNRVVSKAALEESLYGFDDEIGSNSIEVHISRLRKKLSTSPATVAVHTIRGVGYILSENETG